MARSRAASCLVGTAAMAGCLFVLFAGWVLFALPRQAEQEFGLPGKGLSAYEHIYLSARLVQQKESLMTPADPVGEMVPFRVTLGDSVASVTGRLQDLGIITSAQALQDYLVYSGLDTTLQAGEFSLSPRMTPVEVARTLQDATPTETTFVILPGWRVEEIVRALPTSGLGFDPVAFLALVRNPPASLSIAGELPLGAALEGFLFPDRYRLDRRIAAEKFVVTLLENFQLKVDFSVREGFQRQGLSLFQAVSLAAIIQREAVVEDEMPLIASVFLNRLENGMKLDSDPTVQYALGYFQDRDTWWKNPLSLADLKVASPYNTYLNPGLPPGPISNPGLSALLAVAFPAETPYFYFRMACDSSGRHAFAETFEQHLANACP